MFTLLTLGSEVDLKRSKIYMLRTAKNVMYGVQRTEVVSILFHSITRYGYPCSFP